MPEDAVVERSPWIETPLRSYPALAKDIEVDVVVVGAGLTGITTAYLLRQEGVRVALIDRARVAAADTARTTAHLTYVTDSRLHELARDFGNDGARTFWEAGASAIDEIARIVREHSIACDFQWVPGYLHHPIGSTDRKTREGLEQDAAVAAELGFKAQFMESVPWAATPGVRFAHQAKFHPRRYLAALLQLIPGEGSDIFEQTALEEVTEKPFGVKANGRTIRCKYLVIATHNPLMGRQGMLRATLFQTKLALYTSYVLGARLPTGVVPQALFWDTADPYQYVRIDHREDHDYAIFGGEDVKTGQEGDTREVFQRLERKLKEVLPAARVQHRWMGQVIETDDGMPFIGENAEREFIATGFCGNGFTLGTLSAMMARDRYLQRKNPWFEFFRIDRKPFHSGLWRYVTENMDYPYYLLRDRLARAEGDSLEDLAKGEGKILGLKGEKVAAYRDQKGHLTLCSPVCTHLKCLVRWNAADQTWDCPCHGSRFHPTGEVLSGPAEDPLQVLQR
jgi:glycine/D-amino acid oxidase-like deaminating enzyme/nitrite reductase/ring-hydroxylating ferredoxin subunit